MLSPYGVLAAGPLPDTGAPTNQRPQVSTVGSVPVVNIVAPGSNGISHNKYERFDVPTQGAVLNNSPTAATSTLAGALSGNPNLTTGSARVILNEVTSNQPSSLLGQLEVAGQAARVVVANPNGITCDGCGFINTPQVQLAAARPFFAGDKLRFELGAGRLDVGPLGLKALATRLDFIAGQIATSGPIHSLSEINLIAGGSASVGEGLDTRLNTPVWYTGDPFGPPVQSPPPPAIDIGQSVNAGSVRIVLDSQADRRIRIGAAIRASNDILVASRGEISIEAPLVAGQDIGIASRSGNLLLGAWSDSVSPSPLLDAGRDLQLMSWLVSGNGQYLRAGRDAQIGVEQAGQPGSYYAQADIGRIDAGRDVVLSSSEWNAPFFVGGITSAQDLKAGPLSFSILPGLQSTLGAAEQGDRFDRSALIRATDWGTGPNYVFGRDIAVALGGLNNLGVVTVGRDAVLSNYDASFGARLHTGRNFDLKLCDICSSYYMEAGTGEIVADGDIILRSAPLRLPWGLSCSRFACSVAAMPSLWQRVHSGWVRST